VSNWADGDRLLVIGEVVFFVAASFAVLGWIPYPLSDQAKEGNGESFVRIGVTNGIAWIALTGLLLSQRFREWWFGLPGWVKGISLLVYLVYGGWFLAIAVVTWLYPSLTMGMDDDRARRRIQRLIGGVVAFAYGSGLYFWVGAIARAGGDDSGTFMRAHLFDGFACAAAVTLGFELTSRLKPGFSREARWISFIAVYFALVSAGISGSAAFVSGSSDPGKIAGWSGLGAVVGGVVGALTATGYAQRKADELSVAMRRWAQALTGSLSATALIERAP
jgi:hypothetical protein